MTKQIKPSKWSLEELYPSYQSPEFKQALMSIKALADEFSLYREKLSAEMPITLFRELLEKILEMTELARRLNAYSSLLFSENTQNPEALSLMGRVDDVLTESMNKTLFFSLWWKSLSNEEAARFSEPNPDFGYYLEMLRTTKNYTLCEESEKIINLKDMSGVSALENTYSALTNRYTFEFEKDGKKETLTRDGLMRYARDKDPEIRKEAYQTLYKKYGEDGNILAQIYQNIARNWSVENVRLRGYKNPIDVRNTINNIPNEVIDLLLETCRKNRAVFQRYFTLKKKLLGLEKLNRYDLYAPLQRSEKKISFNDAFSTVKKAFAEFEPEFAEMIEKIQKEDHIDSEVRIGKRGGAFCYPVNPALDPWVLVNFEGRSSDVSTLAHELGHAIHAVCSNHHNALQDDACLPLAETASTFGEMLLLDYQLAREKNPIIRRDMLMEEMDGNYATIQRQAYFALFEKTAFDMIEKGADVNELNKAYLENLKEQFGDAVEINEEFQWEWVSIPHFYHTPFYVYAYTFGQLLVLSLYQQYKKEGKSFIPRYRKLLAAGGSETPEKILKDAGFNFYDPSFWQGGFDVLKNNIDLIEKDL